MFQVECLIIEWVVLRVYLAREFGAALAVASRALQ